ITVVPMGAAAEIEFVDAPERIPVPNVGAMNTSYSVKIADQYGSEMIDVPLKWSLTDTDGNVIADEKLTIDASTGVVTSYEGAQTQQVIVKAEVASDPDVYVVSQPIGLYLMSAKTVSIIGDEYFAVPSAGTETKKYTAKLFDQYGVEMPEAEVKTWTTDNSNVSIADGVLTVSNGTEDTTVTISVSSGDAATQKQITVYNPIVSKIEVDGDYSIEIPKNATQDFTYTAKVFDQYGFEMHTDKLVWNMTADDATSLSLDGPTVTAAAGAKEQTVTISASVGEVSGLLKVVVTENPFTYKPIDGGFEIDNGNQDYTRPMYAAHTNDNGLASFRYIYYLGDEPKLVLSNAGAGTFRRYMHMFLGIKGGKWLDEMENITARYINGHEEYIITDSSFDGTIKLTYTRSDKIDGMLVKAELPDGLTDKLVVATAGQSGVKTAQPVGGNSANLEFSVNQTTSTKAAVEGNTFSITNNGGANLVGTASVNLNYAVKDASEYSNGVDALLGAEYKENAMVTGTTEGNTENTVYLLVATDPATNEHCGKYQTQAGAKKIFDDSIAYFKSVSETIKFDTPDPYINAVLKAQVMAMDNIWDNPVITHGAIGWHNGQGGWRGGYCFVNAGWSDRIKTNIQHYMERQNDDGRIWAYPTVDGRYNMNLVMVDIIMQ
ncbi:MAG: DUF4450 domain-containing protein, partial [Clostridia bacterium]|nr:DUF4450 domain-containing protein [Clostridia bacterium]